MFINNSETCHNIYYITNDNTIILKVIICKITDGKKVMSINNFTEINKQTYTKK